jgi:hypothetical protein
MTGFHTLLPDLQIAFYNRLLELRNIFLLDALLATVENADIEALDQQLKAFVSKSALRKVASWGLRGEVVFPIPHLLAKNPFLLGYYRLLLGFSQKEFYGKAYGFYRFKSMEEKGVLTSTQNSFLEQLCKTLCQSSEYLVEHMGKLSKNDVHELTLLTLGPQLRGGVLNLYGSRAVGKVFEMIKAIVEPAILSSSARMIKLQNAAGRKVMVEFASDPDICIREELPSGTFRNLVAIEIKGGRDISNIHNRIGEAEKSHQKARKEGFVECWTMVGVTGLDMKLAKKESPSSDRFYKIDEITKPTSPEFRDFREHLLSRVGVRD